MPIFYRDADTSPLQPLAEAVGLMRPLAMQQPQDGSLTLAQRMYAEALAILNAARSRLRSINGEDATEGLVDRSLIGGLSVGRPGATLCRARLRSDDRLHYPRSALNRFGV